MYGNMNTMNFLGINDIQQTVNRAPRLQTRQNTPESDPVFEASLKAAIVASNETNSNATPQPDQTIPGAIQDANAFSLSRIFKDSVIKSMTGYPKTEENNGVMDTASQNNDDSSVIGTENTNPTDIVSDIIGEQNSTPSRSISDVVFSTANANKDLLNKINSANTIAERTQLAGQLRDEIVTALQNAGYTAEAANKTDKITVNGTMYDVIKASKGLGREAKVQLLEVNPETATVSDRSNGEAEAIFKAGEAGINLLRQLSTSHNVSERRHLAAQAQHLMVEHLNANGYTASAGSSPDKITINGTTYDFIRGLNSPGKMAQFQALKV